MNEAPPLRETELKWNRQATLFPDFPTLRLYLLPMLHQAVQKSLPPALPAVVSDLILDYCDISVPASVAFRYSGRQPAFELYMRDAEASAFFDIEAEHSITTGRIFRLKCGHFDVFRQKPSYACETRARTMFQEYQQLCAHFNEWLDQHMAQQGLVSLSHYPLPASMYHQFNWRIDGTTGVVRWGARQKRKAHSEPVVE